MSNMMRALVKAKAATFALGVVVLMMKFTPFCAASSVVLSSSTLRSRRKSTASSSVTSSKLSTGITIASNFFSRATCRGSFALLF